MSIVITRPYITYRELGDDLSQEIMISQTGHVHRKVHSARRKRAYRVFMPKQISPNDNLDNWRSWLRKGSVDVDGIFWTCIEEPPFNIEYLDDNENIMVLHFVLTQNISII